MKLTVLTENTSRYGLPAEHGLSLYIEANGRKMLFDMGQTGLFAENAQALGIDLSFVEFAVISHGHYDHGGGLKRFLELNSKAPVYLSSRAFGEHYNGAEKYIGLDKTLQNNSRLVFTDGETKIAEGFTLYSCPEMKTVCELGSFGLNIKRNGVLMPEDFRHEHYLMIEENGKRILISGCSHRGAVNIEEHFQPDVFIGGFHFSKLEDEKLRELAQMLDTRDTAYYTCHCTGVQQYEHMKKRVSMLKYISAGQSIEL